jgi:hypothetical protein
MTLACAGVHDGMPEHDLGEQGARRMVPRAEGTPVPPRACGPTDTLIKGST